MVHLPEELLASIKNKNPFKLFLKKSSHHHAVDHEKMANLQINRQIKKEGRLFTSRFHVVGCHNSGKSTLIDKLTSDISSSDGSRSSYLISKDKKCYFMELSESLVLRLSKNQAETRDVDDQPQTRNSVSRNLVRILEDASGIIFCVDVSSLKGIQQSWSLFQLTLQVFKNRSLVIFFTKEEIQEEINSHEFKQVFEDYEGPSTKAAYMNYLGKKFVSEECLTLTYSQDLRDEKRFLLFSSDEIHLRSLINYSNLIN